PGRETCGLHEAQSGLDPFADRDLAPGRRQQHCTSPDRPKRHLVWFKTGFCRTIGQQKGPMNADDLERLVWPNDRRDHHRLCRVARWVFTSSEAQAQWYWTAVSSRSQICLDYGTRSRLRAVPDRKCSAMALVLRTAALSLGVCFVQPLERQLVEARSPQVCVAQDVN